jgi:hypothetical protein
LVRAEVTKAVQARRQEKMRVCDEVIEQQQQRPRLHRRRQPPRPRGDAATEANDEQRQPTDHQVITTRLTGFSFFFFFI